MNIAIGACLVSLLTCSAALCEDAHFYPNGTASRLTVDTETLAATPRWKPSDGPIPLSAADAISVAAKFHNSINLDGLLQFRKWQVDKAILVSLHDDRWFWIVTYRGVFDPSLVGKVNSFRSLEKTTLYSHYPVLLDGTVPKATSPSRAPAAQPGVPIRQSLDSLLELIEDRVPNQHRLGEWPWIRDQSREIDG